MRIFLFSHGGIQLIECGFSASLGLCWYVDSYEKYRYIFFLGRYCGLQLIMRYSTSGEQNLKTSLDIVHQLLFTNIHSYLKMNALTVSFSG